MCHLSFYTWDCLRLLTSNVLGLHISRVCLSICFVWNWWFLFFCQGVLGLWRRSCFWRVKNPWPYLGKFGTIGIQRILKEWKLHLEEPKTMDAHFELLFFRPFSRDLVITSDELSSSGIIRKQIERKWREKGREKERKEESRERRVGSWICWIWIQMIVFLIFLQPRSCTIE